MSRRIFISKPNVTGMFLIGLGNLFALEEDGGASLEHDTIYDEIHLIKDDAELKCILNRLDKDDEIHIYTEGFTDTEYATANSFIDDYKLPIITDNSITNYNDKETYKSKDDGVCKPFITYCNMLASTFTDDKYRVPRTAAMVAARILEDSYRIEHKYVNSYILRSCYEYRTHEVYKLLNTPNVVVGSVWFHLFDSSDEYSDEYGVMIADYLNDTSCVDDYIEDDMINHMLCENMTSFVHLSELNAIDHLLTHKTNNIIDHGRVVDEIELIKSHSVYDKKVSRCLVLDKFIDKYVNVNDLINHVSSDSVRTKFGHIDKIRVDTEDTSTYIKL